MHAPRLISLLTIALFITSLTGCGKSSDQELADKKAKELRKGGFNNPPAKGYGIGP